MLTGTVKWFNITKGYGFIEPIGGGKDVFVHINAITKSGLKTLQENDKVSYKLVVNNITNKESAEDIVLLDN